MANNKLRSVNTKFWEDTFIENLSVEEKLLFIYLLTNSSTNLLGIYEISIKRMMYETGLTNETIRNGLERFEMVNKAFYYDDKFIIITNFLKHQRLNSNMQKNVIRYFSELPNDLQISILGNGYQTIRNDYQTILNGCLKYKEGRKKKEEGRMKKEEKENICKILVSEKSETLPNGKTENIILEDLKESLPEIIINTEGKPKREKKKVINLSEGQEFIGKVNAQAEIEKLTQLIDNPETLTQQEKLEIDKGATYTAEKFMETYPISAKNSSLIYELWQKLNWYQKEFVIEHAIDSYVNSLDNKQYTKSPEEYLKLKLWDCRNYGNNKHYPKNDFRYKKNLFTSEIIYKQDGYPVIESIHTSINPYV